MTERPMRRSDRQISEQEAAKLLLESEYGTLATVNADGSPYNLPLSYAYKDGVIYLHGAAEGQKIDNIKAHPAVCFCVVGNTQLLPDKFTTNYISAIAQGNAEIVSDAEEKKKGLMALIEKYSSGHIPAGIKYIESAFDNVSVIKITVNKLTGKSRR